jgi:ubiquinone/menaquinone biosynthesis C-methylase UbiE
MSFFENTRKPEGFGGKLMVAMMNVGHSAVARWGLQFLNAAPDAKVLDCGCGGGANIKRLLKKCPRGVVKGIDYSPVSVEKSRKVNEAAIAEGRCAVLQGSVADMMGQAREKADRLHLKNVTFRQGDVGALPYADDTFDIVLSLNGFHAFPDKEAAYREVFRVLRPGGTFCGCFYVKGEHKRTDWFVRHIYEKAGFFTPPYETVSSLKARLDGMYTDVDMGNLKSMAWFVCRKAG